MKDIQKQKKNLRYGLIITIVLTAIMFFAPGRGFREMSIIFLIIMALYLFMVWGRIKVIEKAQKAQAAPMPKAQAAAGDDADNTMQTSAQDTKESKVYGPTLIKIASGIVGVGAVLRAILKSNFSWGLMYFTIGLLAVGLIIAIVAIVFTIKERIAGKY